MSETCLEHGYVLFYCAKCLQEAVKEAVLAERRACLAIAHGVSEGADEVWDRINRRNTNG